MQSNDWIDVFRLIPADQHSTLVLTTVSGIDLNIEIVLRTEPTYLVFRGRVSGITDEGRVFFLPYQQINYLQINRTVKEIEIRQLFGETVEARAGDPATAPRSGMFTASAVPTGSHAGLSASNGSRPVIAPAAAVAGPLRGSAQGITSLLSRAPNPPPAPPSITNRLQNGSTSVAGQLGSSRIANVPAAALVPSGATNGVAEDEQPSPPRNSILERLRAQRNSVLPPRAPGH